MLFGNNIYQQYDLLLSSATEVSTGPTCQFLSVCMLSVFPFFKASNWLIILTFDSGSGPLLIQLGVLSLAEQ